VVALPDDALEELWALYDASGVRPEWVLPMLYLESGFDPSIPNAAGSQNYGIAQDFGPYLTRHGIAPADYLKMTAAEQLHAIVVPRLTELSKRWGPLRSATRVYQGNYLPATLKTAPGLASVVAWRGSPEYTANALLDVTKDGAITVSDLAWWMRHEAAEPEAKAAILRAYELRPKETPSNVVYGQDFASPVTVSLAFAVVAAAAYQLATR
jgi:hypothetical protein